jgi:hypothetical protein
MVQPLHIFRNFVIAERWRVVKHSDGRSSIVYLIIRLSSEYIQIVRIRRLARDDGIDQMQFYFSGNRDIAAGWLYVLGFSKIHFIASSSIMIQRFCMIWMDACLNSVTWVWKRLYLRFSPIRIPKPSARMLIANFEME